MANDDEHQIADAVLEGEFGPRPATVQTVEKLVGSYVALRDRLHEMEEAYELQAKPGKELLNKIQGQLTELLDRAGASSIKTPLGTAIVNTKWTASLADPQAFMDYVKANDRFDLMDRRANATAVKDFVKANPDGTAPPGVNLSAIRTIGVRRPTSKAE